MLRDIERRYGLDSDLVVTGIPVPEVASVQYVILAVVKEALTNVVKHAHAHFVLVSVRYRRPVDVVVQDDGVGAPVPVQDRVDQNELHFGVRNMRRQVAALGGTFELLSGDEGGLTVRFSIPLVAGRCDPPAARR